MKHIYTPGCLSKLFEAKGKDTEIPSNLKELFTGSKAAVFKEAPVESEFLKIQEKQKAERVPTGKKKLKKWQAQQLSNLKEKNEVSKHTTAQLPEQEDFETDACHTSSAKKRKKSQPPQSQNEDKNQELSILETEQSHGGKKKRKKDLQEIKSEGVELQVAPENKNEKKKKKTGLPIDLVTTSSDPAQEKVQPENSNTSSNNKDSEDDANKNMRTIFVGNIPTTVKKKTIEKLFAKFGEIESTRIRSASIKGVAVDDAGNQNLVKKVSVNQKRFGEEKDSFNMYVVFKSQAAVLEAVSLNNYVLEGHHLRVDREDSSQQRDTTKTAFLGNLPFSITEEEVRKHFSDHFAGNESAIESVRLIRDGHTQLGKGIGYILFKDRSSMASALSLNKSKLKGREIRVQICGKRLKSQTSKTKPATPSYQGRIAIEGAHRRIQGKIKKQGLGSVAHLIGKKRKNASQAAPVKHQFTPMQMGKSKETPTNKGRKTRTPEQLARRMQKKLLQKNAANKRAKN